MECSTWNWCWWSLQFPLPFLFNRRRNFINKKIYINYEDRFIVLSSPFHGCHRPTDIPFETTTIKVTDFLSENLNIHPPPIVMPSAALLWQPRVLPCYFLMIYNYYMTTFLIGLEILDFLYTPAQLFLGFFSADVFFFWSCVLIIFCLDPPRSQCYRCKESVIEQKPMLSMPCVYCSVPARWIRRRHYCDPCLLKNTNVCCVFSTCTSASVYSLVYPCHLWCTVDIDSKERWRERDRENKKKSTMFFFLTLSCFYFNYHNFNYIRCQR